MWQNDDGKEEVARKKCVRGFFGKQSDKVFDMEKDSDNLSRRMLSDVRVAYREGAWEGTVRAIVTGAACRIAIVEQSL